MEATGEKDIAVDTWEPMRNEVFNDVKSCGESYKENVSKAERSQRMYASKSPNRMIEYKQPARRRPSGLTVWRRWPERVTRMAIGTIGGMP